MRLLKLETKKLVLFCLVLVGVFFVSSQIQARTVVQSGTCFFPEDTYTYCYPPDTISTQAGPGERIISSVLDYGISGAFSGTGNIVLRGGYSGEMTDYDIFSWSSGECGWCPGTVNLPNSIPNIGYVSDGWTDFFIQALQSGTVYWTWTVEIEESVSTGAIQVQSNLAMTANITGPVNYSVSTAADYAPQIFWGVPLGTYTIGNIADLPCYGPGVVGPPGATQTISSNGQTIFFIIDYSSDGSCGGGGGACNGGVDVGLRLYQDGIRKIAVEPGAPTSPLRLYKDGIRGVVLVDPSDPNASKMRVQTSSGIKATCILP